MFGMLGICEMVPLKPCNIFADVGKTYLSPYNKRSKILGADKTYFIQIAFTQCDMQSKISIFHFHPKWVKVFHWSLLDIAAVDGSLEIKGAI